MKAHERTLHEPLKKLAAVTIAMLIAATLHMGWLASLVSAPSAMLLLLGIFASAMYGGLWPGLLATAIGVAVALFSSPDASAADESLQLSLLAVVGVLASLMAHAVHAARWRAETDRLALRRQMQERTATELRLASSERRFRVVVDTLPEAVFAADVDGRIRVLNNNWLDCPFEPRAATRQDLFALVHPDDETRMREAWQRKVETNEALDIRCRMRARDQAFRWVLVRAKANAARGLDDDHCFGVVIDIDDAVARERAMREGDERLRLALDATELGMWDYDFATQAVLCSDRIYSIAGLDSAMPINQAVWLALVVPEDVLALVAHVRQAVAPVETTPQQRTAERGHLDVEYRLRRATDAAIRWVALTGRVTFDAGSAPKPLRANGTLRDVTPRRESVEQLRHSEERLALAQQAGGIGMFDWNVVTDAMPVRAPKKRCLALPPALLQEPTRRCAPRSILSIKARSIRSCDTLSSSRTTTRISSGSSGATANCAGSPPGRPSHGMPISRRSG